MIMDIYTINRILNKNYVKNAIVYAGDAHILIYKYIFQELPKKFKGIKVDINEIKNRNVSIAEIANENEKEIENLRCIKLDKNQKNPFDISFLIPKEKDEKKSMRTSRTSRTGKNIRRKRHSSKSRTQKGGGSYFENIKYQNPPYPELENPEIDTRYNIDKAYDNLIFGRNINDSNYLNIDNTRTNNFQNGVITDNLNYNYALGEQSFM